MTTNSCTMHTAVRRYRRRYTSFKLNGIWTDWQSLLCNLNVIIITSMRLLCPTISSKKCIADNVVRMRTQLKNIFRPTRKQYGLFICYRLGSRASNPVTALTTSRRYLWTLYLLYLMIILCFRRVHWFFKSNESNEDKSGGYKNVDRSNTRVYIFGHNMAKISIHCLVTAVTRYTCQVRIAYVLHLRIIFCFDFSPVTLTRSDPNFVPVVKTSA